jgi:hypothetical protein
LGGTRSSGELQTNRAGAFNSGSGTFYTNSSTTSSLSGIISGVG